jgi:hypothetical protein
MQAPTSLTSAFVPPLQGEGRGFEPISAHRKPAGQTLDAGAATIWCRLRDVTLLKSAEPLKPEGPSGSAPQE